jgi:hypothetical protein
MGEALTDEERAIFAKLTGREREPGERVDELWCVIGRRGGKSRPYGRTAEIRAQRSQDREGMQAASRILAPIRRTHLFVERARSGGRRGPPADRPRPSPKAPRNGLRWREAANPQKLYLKPANGP